MTIMQRSANRLNAIVVVRSNISQKDCRSGNEKEETTNIVKEVKEEAVLLIIGYSSGARHKKVENSTRRLSLISQPSSMERSSRRADSLESLVENVESSMEHKVRLKSSVEKVNQLENSMEQVSNLDNSVWSVECG